MFQFFLHPNSLILFTVYRLLFTSMTHTITIPNITVGHWSDQAARTGCTVVLCPQGATAGVAVRGGAPGTRETDLLQAGRLVQQVHAILLTGGSAFGLAAADGVMRWLAERGFGFDAGVANVPIVPAAVLFDLAVGDPKAYPDAHAGYMACEHASSEFATGAIGAGTGATVGKVLGIERADQGGISAAWRTLADGITIGAIVAVNAFGHIVNPATGAIVAGARDADGNLVDTIKLMLGFTPPTPQFGNTTIGVIITDANLDKAACNELANAAHAGLARTIRPVFTQADGDTLFALSAPAADAPPANLFLLGIAAAEVVAEAVLGISG